MLPLLFCLLLAPQAPQAPQVPALPAGTPARGTDAAAGWSLVDLQDELRRQGEHPDPLLLRALAAGGTPAALVALEELLDSVRSRDARVTFVHTLARFANGSGSRAAALERLRGEARTKDYPDSVSVPASAARDRAVALAAVETIALFDAEGRELLAEIVLSPGDVRVRAAALSAHGRGARPRDLTLYRELVDEEPAHRPIDLAPGAQLRHPLELRVLALTLAGPLAKAQEVMAWSRAPEMELALAALAELGRRGGRVLEEAADLHFRMDARDSMRLATARLMLSQRSRGWGERIVDVALDSASEQRLGPGLVRVLAESFGDRGASLEGERARTELVAYTVRRTRAGRGWTQVAGARALIAAESPDARELFAKLGSSGDPRLRAAAARAAAVRGELALLPELTARLWRATGAGGESPTAQAEELLEEQLALVEAISLLGGGTGPVVETLVQATRSRSRPLRNAALEWLARSSGTRRMDVLASALRHPDWSTRLRAVDALALTLSPRAVPHLIQALALGDARLADAAALVLVSWTRREHGTDPRPWRIWWAGAKDEWQVPAAGERGVVRASKRTRAAFFGTSLGSDHVAFVIDRSGSMAATLQRARSESSGSSANFRPETRMARARRELAAALEALGPGARVQIVVFDDEVRSLWPEATVLDEEHLKEALEFVEKLRAGGGTNLHGGIWRALAESSVDTIVLLSDGEPSSGEVLSPSAIREAVADWNRYRGYALHGVAVGGGLSLVRWLTEDAGGTLVRIP